MVIPGRAGGRPGAAPARYCGRRMLAGTSALPAAWSQEQIDAAVLQALTAARFETRAVLE